MPENFNPDWNTHYDFQNPENLRQIAAVDGYTLENDPKAYKAGEIIHSPWGINQVTDIGAENDEDICIKKITINAGYMLSLQRHRGRKEIWNVKEGVLTVILNGELKEISSGHSIDIPKGAVHSMINSSDTPVVVLETQQGKCREGDNIRLIDSHGRPTYPLTSETEYKSAILYAQVQAAHAKRFGFEHAPHKSLLAAE